MPTNNTPAGDHIELVCQCRLPLSTQTLTFLTGLLSTHLRKIHSRWRKLPAGRIAVIALAALRHGQRLPTSPAATASRAPRWTGG
jgi:hypothetical protein